MAAFVVWLIMTLLWVAIGAVVPVFISRNEHKGLIQMMVILTASCCYIMWLCTFLCQLNPLFGPQLSPTTQMLMRHVWV